MSAEQNENTSTDPVGLGTSPPVPGRPELDPVELRSSPPVLGGQARKFLVGDAVRFIRDSRLRLSFKVEVDEIGTVKNWVDDGTPLQRIDVQFPRDLVRGALASEFERAGTVLPNSARPQTATLPFTAEDNSQVATDTAARQRTFTAAVSSGEVQALAPNATPSPPPQVIELTATSTAMLRGAAQAGSASLGTAVAAAFDRNLQERATEIRNAARVLAKTMREQVAEWRASRPNDPETLTRYDDMLAFLERIAGELERMADKLDEAIATGAPGSPEPVLLGRAGQIARAVGADVTAFLEKNRQDIAGLTVRTAMFGALYLFLHACGLGGEAAGFASGLVTASIPGPERKK